MKRLFRVLAFLAAAIVVSAAAAATPQGHLSGAASLASNHAGITRVVAHKVSDGETVFVGLKNDRSGDCDGDTGTLTIKHGGSATTYNVLCAHYVANFAMGVLYFDDTIGKYVEVRVRERGQPAREDIVDIGVMGTDKNRAVRCVNLGWGDGGCDTEPGYIRDNNVGTGSGNLKVKP
jgi:hypothetical protein